MDFVTMIALIGRLSILAGLFIGAAWDLATRMIPNGVVVGIGVAGVGVRVVTEGWRGALISLAAAAVVFALLRVAAILALLGNGDVKLIAAVALGLPVASLLSVLLAISVAGGVIACGYMVRDRLRRRLRRRRGHTGVGVLDRAAPAYSRRGTLEAVSSAEIPYALAIFGGVLCYELGRLAR